MAHTFDFNDPPGALVVYNPDGAVAFDSRNQSQRILLTGFAAIDGRRELLVETYRSLVIPYGKTFLKPPYVRMATRKPNFDSSNPAAVGQNFLQDIRAKIIPPRIDYFPGGSWYTYLNGAFSSARESDLTLGNLGATGSPAFPPFGTYNGARLFWYAVFDNEVSL